MSRHTPCRNGEGTPGLQAGSGEGEELSWSQLSRSPRVIDELNRRIGIVATVSSSFASLVSAFNAIFRYSTNGIMWLEHVVGGGFFGGIIDIYRQNSNSCPKCNGTCSPAWSCWAPPRR